MSLGIDVSHYNGKLDWGAIARAGVAFAYAKATEGVFFKDPEYVRNAAGAAANSIPFGAYHFFRPDQPALLQAGSFIRAVAVRSAGAWAVSIDLPPALDLEEALGGDPPLDRWTATAPETRAGLIVEWLEDVEHHLGVRPILYTRAGWLDRMIPADTRERLAAYELWIAHYTTNPAPSLPIGWTKWRYWQYTDKGTLPGVSGVFDLDRAADSAPNDAPETSQDAPSATGTPTSNPA